MRDRPTLDPTRDLAPALAYYGISISDSELTALDEAMNGLDVTRLYRSNSYDDCAQIGALVLIATVEVTRRVQIAITASTIQLSKVGTPVRKPDHIDIAARHYVDNRVLSLSIHEHATLIQPHVADAIVPR